MFTTWVLWIFNAFIVILGYGDLSVNKNTDQCKTFIGCSNCTATNAVDRNISTCTRTDMGQTSPEKFTWWYVDLGDVHIVYNIRIQFKDYGQMYAMRQRGRFAGFSLYVSNSTERQRKDLCYKNGPELPSLDFNTNCTKYGRYIIFYNERLSETNYPEKYVTKNVVTELCEVTVTDCSDHGVYGIYCDKSCPENCQNRRCDVISGTCFSCAPGWLRENCTEACHPGYYGLECESTCAGHCKDNKPCNHTNGLCDNGCDGGWAGENCTEECPIGTFGPYCVFNCSGQCLGDVPCNRTSGRCDTGCKPGYTGEMCDRGCGDGKFGIDCSYHCSGNCLNNVTCNETNGHCDSGCASGYLEAFCNKTCNNGTYGPNCIQNCSLNCTDGSCNNVDGSCTCTSSYCNEKSKSVKTGQNIEAVIGSVGAGVLLLIVVVIIANILRQRRNKSKKADKREETMGFSSMDDTLIKSKRRPPYKTGTQNDVLKSETKERSKGLISKESQNLNGLKKYLYEIKNTKMEEEYRAIPKGELHSCIEGKRQENKSKNRYTTIFPYDHSRVVLNTSTTESDYINANYIEDVFGKKKYIATQGPKDSTIADFWRMVWHENARIIVCLTNISEAKTKKCAKYWPDLNDKHMEGDISVRCQKEQTYAENVVRHLRIKNISLQRSELV